MMRVLVRAIAKGGGLFLLSGKLSGGCDWHITGQQNSGSISNYFRKFTSENTRRKFTVRY